MPGGHTIADELASLDSVAAQLRTQATLIAAAPTYDVSAGNIITSYANAITQSVAWIKSQLPATPIATTPIIVKPVIPAGAAPATPATPSAVGPAAAGGAAGFIAGFLLGRKL